MARTELLRCLLLAVGLGFAGCTGSVVVVDSRHPDAPNWRGEWDAQSAGPRLGVVCYSEEAAAELKKDHGVGPTLGLFGWQFDFLYALEGTEFRGLLALSPMVEGMEQGEFILSLNAAVGLRSGNGWEITAGPSMSVSGIGFSIGIGKVSRRGALSIPVNFAVVSDGDGLRYVATIGTHLCQ